MADDLRETRLPGVGFKYVIERGDTLVTVAKAGQYAAFRRLLERGEPGGSSTSD